MKNKTTNFNFSHHYAIVVFMITLFVFMSGINIFLIDYQKKHFINEKKEHIEDSLELVGLILKEKILKREYYAIEDIILNWETDYIFILSLNVVARNGNILASRGSQISSSNVWKISREIFEGDSLIFTINAVIDLTPFDKQEKSLILRFLLISFILTLLLGLILWQIFRKLALDRLKSEVLHRIDAEKQTRQWNDFLTLIIESLTYPFYVIDLNTHKIIIANKASGWDGKNPNITCYQLTHNKDVPCYGSEHSCPIELVKKTKAPVVLEHVHFNSKGELRNMEVHGFPIFDSFGNLVKMIEYSIDISEKKLLEVQLKESREYFQKVTQYTQSGVIIVNANLLNITDANRYAYAFLGCSYSELLGSSITDFFSSNSLKGIISHERFNLEKTEDCICKTKTRGEVKVRLTISYLQLHQDDHLLLNFIDISDIHELLDKQNINIQLAKNVLSLVNSENPRYVHISDSSHLFFDYLSIPFHKEGGDHFFVRTLEKTSGTKDLRTFISLKDQSGHEVNCVLKSIITDLIHHSVISNNSDSSLEEILFELNNNILNSFMLPEDGFMTAFSAEINHETLNLKYASCGHPPIILIRDNTVYFLPDKLINAANLPLGLKKNTTFNVSEIMLKNGDKLIFYTDGLIEMPFKNKKFYIEKDDLRNIIQEIISRDSEISVSEIIKQLLHKIANISEETVIPFEKNTSDDDITIIGLDVEMNSNFTQMCFTPKDLKECEDYISIIYQKIKKEWDKHGFEHPEFRLMAILEESIMNAWKHGNKFSQEKNITVSWKKNNDFFMDVIDQGEGFDYNGMPNPTDKTNIQNISGRGIFLMKYFSDQMFWNDKGNKTTFIFQKKSRQMNPLSKNRNTVNIWSKPNTKGDTNYDSSNY